MTKQDAGLAQALGPGGADEIGRQHVEEAASDEARRHAGQRGSDDQGRQHQMRPVPVAGNRQPAEGQREQQHHQQRVPEVGHRHADDGQHHGRAIEQRSRPCRRPDPQRDRDQQRHGDAGAGEQDRVAEAQLQLAPYRTARLEGCPQVALDRIGKPAPVLLGQRIVEAVAVLKPLQGIGIG